MFVWEGLVGMVCDMRYHTISTLPRAPATSFSAAAAAAAAGGVGGAAAA